MKYTSHYRTEDGGRTYVRLDPVPDDPLERRARELDLGTVLVPAPALVCVDVDGELVGYVPDQDVSFVLDRLSAACWHCLDGEASVADILDDLVAVTGWDAAEVEEHYAPMFRRWASIGAVDVVGAIDGAEVAEVAE